MFILLVYMCGVVYIKHLPITFDSSARALSQTTALRDVSAGRPLSVSLC